MTDSSELVTHLQNSDTTRDAFVQAVQNAFPLAISVFTYGLAYGALAHTSNHLSLWQTLAMSIFVFAGASQFTVLALLHQGAAAFAIILSAFLLNARQILYGFTLGPFLRHIRWKNLLWLSHGLTDESFSVTIVAAKQRHIPSAYFAGAGSMVFFPWLVSSALGYLAGSAIGNPTRFGLDFAYIGAFLGLLVAQLHKVSQLVAAVVAACLASVFFHFFGTTGAILSGAAVAFGIGVYAHDDVID